MVNNSLNCVSQNGAGHYKVYEQPQKLVSNSRRSQDLTWLKTVKHRPEVPESSWNRWNVTRNRWRRQRSCWTSPDDLGSLQISKNTEKKKCFFKNLARLSMPDFKDLKKRTCINTKDDIYMPVYPTFTVWMSLSSYPNPAQSWIWVMRIVGDESVMTNRQAVVVINSMVMKMAGVESPPARRRVASRGRNYLFSQINGEEPIADHRRYGDRQTRWRLEPTVDNGTQWLCPDQQPEVARRPSPTLSSSYSNHCVAIEAGGGCSTPLRSSLEMDSEV